jgi:hypothetical protein
VCVLHFLHCRSQRVCIGTVNLPSAERGDSESRALRDDGDGTNTIFSLEGGGERGGKSRSWETAVVGPSARVMPDAMVRSGVGQSAVTAAAWSW